MKPPTTEQAFESAIECALLQGGPDACPHYQAEVREPSAPYALSFAPGGYRRRTSADYDRELCLIPKDVIDFLVASQPKEWRLLRQHRGAGHRDQFLNRLAGELSRRGVVDVLRNGVKDSGCKFDLAYFRPASGLNEETQRLHATNLFAVVRQLHYSTKNESSLDLGIFLNGIPLFTAELKNPLTGQDVQDAVAQFQRDRDPREPLLKHRRCVAHFAVDPNLVCVTTQLSGGETRFLPFNRGHERGAGNPPVPPTRRGYPTGYLWNQVWARDSVLELIGQFVHEVQDSEDRRRSRVVFPRYQQLDAVRRMVWHAREHGAGQHYLVQHSAGSGKSYTVAWLAHQLSSLHDSKDRSVFDSVVVITDRKVLDRQLQRAIHQFEQTVGVVENIDKTSRQLREALEAGRRVIVSTLQKFPVIAEEMVALTGKRFAVIVDEAHSSQTGESAKSLKAVLASRSLKEAEAEEARALTPEEERDAVVLEEMRQRGRQPNLSIFAFTATPKSKTLELFGTKQADGTFKAFHLYSMRQAIEERFILDVLANYATYEAYWELLKVIRDDPRYEKRKAAHLLKSFVELHPHAVRQKVAIMAEHFAAQVQHQVAGRAKAMIVTRSRLHAVRYKRALDTYLREKGYQWKTLVAFSGTVKDKGKDYTESGMNSPGTGHVIGEKQTADEFAKPEYRFLVVANKFQTGFDQPLLHTMYVDKKLGGVNAVQTLSRLNRTHDDKTGTAILDFANDAEAIQKAFKDYYETTLLAEETDPNLLYEVQRQLIEFAVYSDADVERFARVHFGSRPTHDRYYAALEECVDRFGELEADDRRRFRNRLRDYNRLYSFLSQVITFADPDLEKLHAFTRHLLRLLPPDPDSLPLEVQQAIDMRSYRIQRTGQDNVSVSPGPGILNPQGLGPDQVRDEEIEALSRIIQELNERFGLDLGPEHRVTLGHMMDKLDGDTALEAAARANPIDNVRLSFDHKVEDAIEEIYESNADLYTRIKGDLAFGKALKELLFVQFMERQLLAVPQIGEVEK